MKANNSVFKTGYYLTDGGLETTLIYHHGIELNEFAAFELVNDENGQKLLTDYYQQYLKISALHGTNFILEAPTWRSNTDWGLKLGYSRKLLDSVNKDAISLMRKIASENIDDQHVIISGCVGPRGDGYLVDQIMSIEQSLHYHMDQVQAFAIADADIVTALTMNYTSEAIGIVQAAQKFNIPVIVSFTVETDGNLPSGESVKYAIQRVDDITNGYATHFMINCAHPEHFKDIFKEVGNWKDRIKGIRANASNKSHEELDNSCTLDAGDKFALATYYQDLSKMLPNLQVIGGCCGTDHSHIEEICEALIQHEHQND